MKGDGKAEGGGRVRFPTVLTSIPQEKQQWTAVMWREGAARASNVRSGEEILFVRVKWQGQVGYSLRRSAPHAERGRPGVTKKQQGFRLLSIFIKVTMFQ